MLKSQYLRMIRTAGFTDVGIVAESSFAAAVDTSDAASQALLAETGLKEAELQAAVSSVVSAEIEAVKPAA